MHGSRFDAFTRSLTPANARRLTRRLLGVGVAGVIGGSVPDDARAKNCGPCKKKKNGKCAGNKPNGTPCKCDKTCQKGKCVQRFCSGKNTCLNGDILCNTSGAICACVLDQRTGKHECAGINDVIGVASCDQCLTFGENYICYYCSGNNLSCAAPCANPK